MVYFVFVSMKRSAYSYWNILVFLIYLHSYNYVQQNYFYDMFFVYMMSLLLVELFGNPFVSISQQQRVLLWVV